MQYFYFNLKTTNAEFIFENPLFHMTTLKFENTFTERLGNPADYDSNIFFKLCHNTWTFIKN